MPPRIGPKRPRRIYLREWREHRDLTQERFAQRLGTTQTTVYRWERSQALLNTNVMAAIAEALDIEPADLYRHPDQPSPGDLLRDMSPELIEDVTRYIEYLKSKQAS